MNWRYAYASVPGTSHIRRGTECQDFCDVALDGETLILLACDGAGSKKYSREGAEAAANAVFRFFKSHPTMTTETGIAALKAARLELQTLAKKRELPWGEFSSTLLVVVVRAGKTLVLHVGDGGIALDFGEGKGLELVSAPMTAGEYANMTYFVTSQNPQPQIRVFDATPVRIALLTDGLETIALNLREQTAPESFFAPFFETLAAESALQTLVNQGLARFLGSDDVNECTDDDKTLVLAVDTVRYRPVKRRALLPPSESTPPPVADEKKGAPPESLPDVAVRRHPPEKTPDTGAPSTPQPASRPAYVRNIYSPSTSPRKAPQVFPAPAERAPQADEEQYDEVQPVAGKHRRNVFVGVLLGALLGALLALVLLRSEQLLGFVETLKADPAVTVKPETDAHATDASASNAQNSGSAPATAETTTPEKPLESSSASPPQQPPAETTPSPQEKRSRTKPRQKKNSRQNQKP